MNMPILYTLEKFRLPVLNFLFLGVSFLGTEGASVIAAFVIYWCVNKRKGLFVTANVLLSGGLNQIVKVICHVPRPFVKYPDFSIVESARSTATGYSFPSGHTQNAAALYGSIACASVSSAQGSLPQDAFTARRKKPFTQSLPVSDRPLAGLNRRRISVRTLCIVLFVLIAFSRLYLGAHYPTDVLAGAALGAGVLLLTRVSFRRLEETPFGISLLFGAAALILIGTMVFAAAGPLQVRAGEAQMKDLLKGIGTCAGIALAVAVGVPLERRYVRFAEQAPLRIQILKSVPGMALLGMLILMMKPLSTALLGTGCFHYILQFFVPGIFGITIWPMTFRFFSSRGTRDGDATLPSVFP